MEMDESALRHIMDVQTQMLQNMTRLQEDQLRNDAMTTGAGTIQNAQPGITTQLETLQPPIQLSDDGHLQTPLPSSIQSPTVPLNPDTGLPVYSASDPTQYGTAATFMSDGGRQDAAKTKTNSFSANGFIAGTIAEMRDFNPTRQSKEATSTYFAEQTRGIQEQAVDMVGGIAGGATTAASFFVPGILPSLLVGGAAAIGVGAGVNAVSQGAKDALDYQQILQQEDYKFINPFESTDEMGGIGLGLGNRQDLSGFLRDLGDEEFLDDPDLQSILTGASQNNLLKSVQDTESFKKKFTNIVDAVKEIAVTMNSSLEEATQFLGEMERRGIGLSSSPAVAAQTKMVSSMLGISTDEGLDILLNTSDNIVAGTGLKAENIIQSTAENTFFAQTLQDDASENNPEMYNYMKNMGGAKEAGSRFETIGRQFLESGQGSANLVGLFGAGFQMNEEGRFEVNESAMESLMDPSVSIQEMQQQSREFLNTLEPTQIATLEGMAPEIFSASADSGQIAQFLKRNIEIVQEASNGEIDEQTALIQGLGVTDNYADADFITEMIGQNSDVQSREMFRARTLKEETDSSAIADSPSMMTRAKFWVERNIQNPLGDVGQNVSDSIGTGMEDYQKWVTGIDNRSMVGGEKLEDFNQGGLENVISGLESTNSAQERMAERLREDVKERQGETSFSFLSQAGRDVNDVLDIVTEVDIEAGKVDLEQLKGQIQNEDSESFRGADLGDFANQAFEGRLSAAEVGGLAQSQEDMNWLDRRRSNVALDAAEGEYDGFLGKLDYFTTRAGLGVAGGAESLTDNTYGRVKGWITGEEPPPNVAGVDLTQKSLEKSQEELKESRKDLNEQAMSLFRSGDLGDLTKESMEELEKAIETGDLSAVEAVTSNEDAARLASEYSTLGEDEKLFGEGQQGYNDLKRYTKGVATVGTQLGDLLKTSGVYEESDIDAYLGDIIDMGKDTTEDLKEGKLSAAQMVEASADTEDQLDSFFNSMERTGKAQGLAEFMVSRDATAAEKVFAEGSMNADGTGTVDIDGLQKYVMDQLRNQHITETNKKDDKDSGDKSKEAKKVTEEHSEALGYYLDNMKSEIDMLRDAAEGRNVGSYTSTAQR